MNDATTRSDRVLLSALIVAVFARGLFTPLQPSWDDGRFIINNERVLHVSWDAFVAHISSVQHEAFHPLHMLSYWLDVPWFGPNAFVIHATSLLLWVMAGLCVHTALQRLGLSRWPALLAALLCMTHPAQVEAVTWATGRKDVLAMLFSAAAIIWHLRSERFNDRAAWIARGLLTLAALSKTSVATLPLFLMLIDVGLSRRSLRAAFAQQLPALLLMLFLGGLTALTWQGSQMLGVRGAQEPNVIWRWAATVTHHLATALWPSRVAPMYPSHHWADAHPLHWVGPVFVLLGTLGLWRAGNRLAAMALLGFVALLLPGSNLLPMVFPLQDRYLSLPLLALALCVGSMLQAAVNGAMLQAAVSHTSAAQRSSRWLPVVAVLCALIAVRTVQYQGAWRSELALWQHAVATQPRAYYAWMKLGEVRRDAGDLAGSVRAYRAMVQLVPGVELGHAALFHALVLFDEKHNHLVATPPMDLARRFLSATRDPSGMHQLAQLLMARNYDEAAAMALDYALTLQPYPRQVLTKNAERFEHERRTAIANVLRRHEKQSAQ